MAGAPADCVMFSEYVSKNMALYAINNDMSLSTHATANYIRGEVSARHAHARGRAAGRMGVEYTSKGLCHRMT